MCLGGGVAISLALPCFAVVPDLDGWVSLSFLFCSSFDEMALSPDVFISALLGVTDSGVLVFFEVAATGASIKTGAVT